MEHLTQNGCTPNDPLFYLPTSDPEKMFDFKKPLPEAYFSQSYMKRLEGYLDEYKYTINKRVRIRALCIR